MPPAESPVAAFLRLWAPVTLTAAVLMTAVDAMLLERSRGFFTGGFLAVDHLVGLSDTALFIMMSLVTDAAVAGLLAAVAMVLLGRWRLSRAALAACGLMVATAPLLLADAASYQLVRYLGVDFDLGLMFDLTGRSVSEMFAVSSAYLVMPTLVVVAATMIAGAIIWAINRVPGRRSVRPGLRVFVLPLLLAIAACASLAVAATASDALENGLLRKPSGQALSAAVAWATDLDRDGFGLIGALSDADPLDAAVFPYAVDIPGNGIDEDGVGGDLPTDARRLAESPAVTKGWTRTPDIVLIVLESFRADVVGARLDARAVTPVMDALAARGVSSSDAYSHNGYTVQSRFHLLAGTMIARVNAPTLIDDFRANGYVVGYFSGQDESFGAEAYRVGFDRAHVAHDARSDKDRRYSTFATPGSLAVSHHVVRERVQDFLRDRQQDERPMLLYVNFEDSHFPYSHDGIETLVSDVRIDRAEIKAANRDKLWQMYLNTAASVDKAVGDVLERVRQVRGREPGVIITADHGESLFESGFLGHGYGLNDVQTRVPFIVANLPMRVTEPFGHVDLRRALTTALTTPLGEATDPVLEKSATGHVFQYLGELRRPKQIAFTRDGRRLIYDFRKARVQKWDESWVAPSELSGGERGDFLQLLHQWEWMNLARRSAPPDGE